MSRASSADVSAEANRAAAVPYLRAEHPQNRCAVSPDQITDDTILTFPQGQVTARDARALGWLAPAAATSPQPQPNSGQPNASSEPPKAEVHPDLDATAFADTAVEQSLSELVTNVSGTEQMEAIRGIVENGEIDQQTLSRAASQLQIEPAKVQEQLAPIMKAFEQQARSVMSEGGLDSNDVVSWAQEHRRDKLNLAMHKQGTQRTTAGYATLRQDYLSSLGEHRPEVALAADLGPGNTAYKDDKGRVIVRLADGSTMSWKSAIQAFGPKK